MLTLGLNTTLDDENMKGFGLFYYWEDNDLWANCILNLPISYCPLTQKNREAAFFVCL